MVKLTASTIALQYYKSIYKASIWVIKSKKLGKILAFKK
jgi:hypothetical protein